MAFRVTLEILDLSACFKDDILATKCQIFPTDLRIIVGMLFW